MAELVFQPAGTRVKVETGTTILEAARLLGLDLVSACGGHGNCGKCRVILESMKNVTPPTEAELRHLPQNQLSEGYRLACQTSVRGSLTIRVPEESRTGRLRLQVEGVETRVELEPVVEKYFVQLPKPTLQDSKPDVERLLEQLNARYGLKKLHVTYELLKEVATMLRKCNWHVTCIIWNRNKIIGIEPQDTAKRNFGFAVDIGTTKLAGYLLNLGTGEVVAATSLMNPQISFGEDVITRISHASHGFNGLAELQQAVLSGINRMLMDLCEKVGVGRDEVYEVVAVGNTAMHHLFLNICPTYLSLSPYVPVIKAPLNLKARELGVNINPNGNIHVLPVIAGFVGADCVAGILATEVYKRDELCMFIDVGTNTEVVLGNRNGMLACSCASGPAFEGAHIKHGMRAASGAVERVWINPETLDVKYLTIDKVKPCGVCGSAMVDFLAEALKAGIIDVAGKLNTSLDNPRIRGGREPEFVLCWKDETALQQDIVITQNDVRQLQLAKAAIHTGATTLMKRAGVTEKDLDMVFIAGAFGSYVDAGNARTVGMYPEVSLEKVKVVGNSAGSGARMVLCSNKARRVAVDISRMVEYVELAADPDFAAEFSDSCYLPYADLSRYPETCSLLRRMGKFPSKLPVRKRRI